MGGKRIFLLVDASASMLAEDIVNAVRRKLFPPETRLRARKWRQAVKAVDWLDGAAAARRAVPALRLQHAGAARAAGHATARGSTAKDGATLDKAIATLRQTAPEGGTSLYHAFAAAQAMNPPPDNIILLTDGLPTQGADAARAARPSRAASACALFDARARRAAAGRARERRAVPHGGRPHGGDRLLEAGHRQPAARS